MRIVIDNNLWISFLIGKRLSSLRPIFNRTDFEVYFCDELEQEFLAVSHRTKIMKYIAESQIQSVHQLMIDKCHYHRITLKNDNQVRDPRDNYLLELAEWVRADYLVTGDADLLTIEQYHNTKIVTFNMFLESIVEKNE